MMEGIFIREARKAMTTPHRCACGGYMEFQRCEGVPVHDEKGPRTLHVDHYECSDCGKEVEVS